MKELSEKNVKYEVRDGKLHLEIDLSKDYGPSKSGDTIVVATVGAPRGIPEAEGFKLGLTVFKPNPAKKK
jgi:hypothetical protein